MKHLGESRDDLTSLASDFLPGFKSQTRQGRKSDIMSIRAPLHSRLLLQARQNDRNETSIARAGMLVIRM